MTTPMMKAETVKIQSRFENLNNVWKIKASIKAPITTMICAVSIPRANSNIGNNLSVALPESILLK